MDLLLDTCAVLWLAQGEGLGKDGQRAIVEAFDAGRTLRVSPITAWEVGMLVSRGRISLRQPPLAWFRKVLAPAGIELGPMGIDVLLASSALPGEPPRDPADRIIAATAREHGYTVLTRDSLLLAYAEAGHLSAMSC